MDYQLVVLRGRSATTALKLGDGVTTAGRHDDCEIRIKSSEVSRKHCQFFEKDGMLLVKDLGSSNGTFLNGKKIEGQRVLEPGDELSVGPVKLRIEQVGKPASPARPAGPADTAVPAAAAGSAVADEFEIAFDDPSTAEDQTVAAKPRPKAQPAPAAKAPEPEPAADAEIGDDAIADFLLDLKLDEED